ncbi:TspO/MBR family protein [Duganella qianjiadongensis]|uniref:Tryptophan-rich sensory protein n=1 Tax=Duganella qianjiadongensis TaxID=2692176 RepID=A0ABW9VL49_9BURK|nr:TspO/MBR family protein [Duganella qianjiadongensis]MYM39781.1 tryptophan-rich sensory protein [Duganella qianjiadongensis]
MTSNSARTALAYQLIWFPLTFACAALGARASVSAAAFYAALTQPAWAPPAWLFGPVWSVLYLLMAIAAWRISRQPSGAARTALLLYAAQLALNALWSWLFFGWHLGAAAFLCLLAMWALILATLIRFYRLERLSAWLLFPYIAWVSFAGVLCYTIWQLNPVQLG